ncbi:polyprenyl synthetase family protein [Lyticum sinuosum]|uniref:Polyprenyl synthetase family protein n=1 Tax=Lyticum sinuosum TaxID=1332059 RepID=A0AAE5AHQ2_9RICK|nr:polyprenyl synthetase family protein [Lyticum sinuosum]MDZ5761388.1 Polyprenyl synthetase family protein [Lyticum sinuosum]
MQSLKKIKDFLKKELKVVHFLISESIKSSDSSYLKDIAKHISISGGKNMRLTMTLFIFRSYNPKFIPYDCDNIDFVNQNNNHLNKYYHIYYLAASIEILHIATLLHDDVIDNSNYRRHKITAHKIWGNKQAILVGDFLFSQSFKFLVKTGSIFVLESIAQASAYIATAEIKQINNIIKPEDNNKEIIYEKIDKFSIETYIEIIKGKTAELFASSCETAAVLSKNKKDASIWREFGLNFGLTFQIIDDLIDYTVNKEILGKDAMLDIKEGKITIPIIILWNNADYADRITIISIFNNIHKENYYDQTIITIISDMFNKYNIINLTLSYAQTYAGVAISALDRIKRKYPLNHHLNFNINILKDLLIEILQRKN